MKEKGVFIMNDNSFMKFLLIIFIIFLAGLIWTAIQGALMIGSGVLMYMLVWEVNCELRQQKGVPGVPETIPGKLAAGGVAALVAFASILVTGFFSYFCPGVGDAGMFLLCIGAFLALRNLKKKHKFAVS